MLHSRQAALIVLAILLPLACGPRALPEEFLGTWYPTGSGGGLDGAWRADESGGHVVIRAEHVLETFDERGELLARERFAPSRGKTIFAEEERWILRFEGGEEEVLLLSEDGATLSLNQNAHDGLGRQFARSR